MITGEQLVDKIRELGKRYPDGKYVKEDGECRYTLGSVAKGPIRCGCIVGQAIVELDPSLVDVLRDADCKFSIDAPGICTKVSIVLTNVQKSWLRKVQNEQDQGETWSDAIATADRTYPLT